MSRLVDLFGESVTYDDNSRMITFNVDNLGYDGFDTSPINQINIDFYTSKLFWSLLHYLYLNQPETNNDETLGIYVTNQGKRTAVRNNVAQFSFGFLVSAYAPDNLGSNLDPDDMIPQEQILDVTDVIAQQQQQQVL